MKRIKNWFWRAWRAMVRYIKDFLRNVMNNWESATILTFAGIGLSNVLSRYIVLPVALASWVAFGLVIPIISVGIIWLLASLPEWRGALKNE